MEATILYGLVVCTNKLKQKTGLCMEHLSEILSFLGGLLAGWTLKFIVDKSKNSTTIRDNIAGGDIAGRDIKKK
ncbi:hypothetical protein PQR68_28345 [Paraburkholderia agricolaris]|uniref:hypothetical protein n=1 Tax=Paraburkholderia agricolaris TaxID=2152888 RepID=UPI0038B7CB91